MELEQFLCVPSNYGVVLLLHISNNLMDPGGIGWLVEF